ncbi:MAG: ATP-binding protein, partial [Deltaproteobacteria bacterium]|nr:ATP-binding protein [Deltaproteobacteria bacterium]
MRYRTRQAEGRLRELSLHFKVVLVTGARQVGKSTLLRQVFPELRAFTFDPDQDLYGARADPDLFLDNFPAPLLLDEIQYAPELLPAIKRRVDERDAPGQYLLSGSQNLQVLRQVSESLAGRVGILPLEGLSRRELTERGGEASGLAAWLSDPDAAPPAAPAPAEALPRILWRGGMPGLLDFPDHLVPDYHRSYVQTYLERDVRSLSELRSLADFGRFLGLSAALTAQEINDAQLGRELGVSPPTARAWRELMVHSFQWWELPPFQGNAVKRVSGRRKGHLADTGLACWLQRVSSPDALAVSPLFGRLFETWVVGEVRKALSLLATPPAMYHWRTAGGAEVDLVLERDGRLFPLEIKAGSRLDGHALQGLRAFR